MIDTHTLLHLDPHDLEVDPENVRRDGPGDLDALASSVREHGLLQPIGVARENGGYRVVYGNRRREAAIIAGLPQVPCLLVDGARDDQLVCQLLENLQRRDLNDLDKADGLARLRRHLTRDNPALGERDLDHLTGAAVGLAGTTVRRYLGLRELAPGVRDLIAEGALGVTQAQHLRVVEDPVRQEDLAQRASERGASAASLGRAARLLADQPAMSAEQALDQGERGVEAPTRKAPGESLARLPRAPRAERDESDAELWPEEEGGESEDDPTVGPRGPSTADGHRRYTIKTIGAFVDNVDRLARSLQDGDLARAADQEDDAPVQLRLALRQLGYVTGQLEQMLRRNGWGL